MGKSWVCCIRKACFIRCDQVEGFFVWFAERILQSFTSGYLAQKTTPILYAAFASILALGGGAAVGIIVGAIKGQTTETGLVRGSAIGAIAGAITALQFLDSKSDHDHPLSKVMNGKVFMEWVNLAVLEAYQCKLAQWKQHSQKFQTFMIPMETRKNYPTLAFKSFLTLRSILSTIPISITIILAVLFASRILRMET